MGTSNQDGDEGVTKLITAMVLGIYAGAPNAAEARRLIHAFLGAVWNSERPKTRRLETAATEGLEAVLVAVGRIAQLDHKPNIEDAKTWLRKQGNKGKRLTGRRSKLSKVRNAMAHPGAYQLLRDIEEMPWADTSESSTPEDETRKSAIPISDPAEQKKGPYLRRLVAIHRRAG